MIKGQPAMNLSATVRAGTTALAIACENGRAEWLRSCFSTELTGIGQTTTARRRPTSPRRAGTSAVSRCWPVSRRAAGHRPAAHPFANDPLGIARTGLIGAAVMHGEADCLAYLLELLNDVPKALATSYHDGLGPRTPPSPTTPSASRRSPSSAPGTTRPSNGRWPGLAGLAPGGAGPRRCAR